MVCVQETPCEDACGETAWRPVSSGFCQDDGSVFAWGTFWHVSGRQRERYSNSNAIKKSVNDECIHGGGDTWQKSKNKLQNSVPLDKHRATVVVRKRLEIWPETDSQIDYSDKQRLFEGRDVPLLLQLRQKQTDGDWLAALSKQKDVQWQGERVLGLSVADSLGQNVVELVVMSRHDFWSLGI
jgi:hypothetical protein